MKYKINLLGCMTFVILVLLLMFLCYFRERHISSMNDLKLRSLCGLFDGVDESSLLAMAIRNEKSAVLDSGNGVRENKYIRLDSIYVLRYSVRSSGHVFDVYIEKKPGPIGGLNIEDGATEGSKYRK